MNYGQALKDESTIIGRAAAEQAIARRERIAKAQKIAAVTGKDIVDVLTEIWGTS